MSTKPLAERPGEEIWESNIPGRIFVAGTNPNGRPVNHTVKGKNARLRIKTLDRQIAEEGIRLPENNPFRNGALTRIDSGPLEGDSSNALRDHELFELFNLSPAEFAISLSGLTELNVRRLKDAAIEHDATTSQIEAIKSVIEEKWPLGKSTPTYDEMFPTSDSATA